MNEETTLPAEMPSDPEPEMVTETDAAEATESLDGALTEGTIYEDLSGSNIEETVVGTVISLEAVQDIGSSIIHAELFGSFLICGTLVGLFLFRGIHGST